MIAIATFDHLRQSERPFLTRIRLRAWRRILWLRSRWARGSDDPDQGLAISHAEVDRILEDPHDVAHAEARFYETDPGARDLATPIQDGDWRAATDATWDRLRRELSLTEPELDLLSLTVAAEVEPLLRRVYGYLNNDANACAPTPWLASGLFQWRSAAPPGPDSALVRWRLAQPTDGQASPWSITASWTADPAIVTWIIRGQVADRALGAAVQPALAEAIDRKPCLYPAVLADMQTFVETLLARPGPAPEPLELEIVGPPGAGKQTLAHQLCATLGVDVFVADAGLILGSEVPLLEAVERVIRATRAARLGNAVLYWRGVDGVDARVWRLAPVASGLTLFGATVPQAQPERGRAVRRSFRLPRLTRLQRVTLWSHLSDQAVPDPVAGWLLTPAEIAGAARVAPAGPGAVTEACRQALYQGPGELFTPLACPYAWDDIVLAPAVRRHLMELEEQARLRWPVYEEWGFERLCALGRGVTALFAGPSGTGKTMAAQVVARSLGMDLHRVDLAGVMNKYIGETEKRLKQVFDACERANVLLLFDEADALFGQRTQVKDAHDRFANVEIDYLLQRMEQFDGIAILATNRKGDLDPAFVRRLRFIVDFMLPGPPERLRLWQLALPERAPDGTILLDRLDWDVLAANPNLTGADIKAAALAAAFRARAEGVRIGMRHVLYAVRRELAKHGIVLRAGDWET